MREDEAGLLCAEGTLAWLLQVRRALAGLAALGLLALLLALALPLALPLAAGG